MFRLTVAILVFLLIDWIAFGGQIILLWLAHKLEAGAGFAADLIIGALG